MIRRRSTLDAAQRVKRTRQVQIFNIIDLCLQLPSDDRLILRNQVKEGDEQLSSRILQCKRDKNYQSLQIYLRKYIQNYKEVHRYGINVVRHSNRGKTPQTIKSITKNLTQTSFHNSIQNSLQSSPSAKKPSQPMDLSKLDLQRHIENQINKQIKQGISRQQCEIQCRDITPRQYLPEKTQKQHKQLKTLSKFNCQENVYKKNIYELQQFNIKNTIKAKMQGKHKDKKLKLMSQNPIQIEHQYKQNSQFQTIIYRQQDTKSRQKCEKKQNITNIKYGQFYKRIKRVIQQIS